MNRFDAFGVFAAVADAGAFATAARRLGRSAAAVTRTIAALESELGVQLLRRTTRVVRLTDAGARFLTDVRRILSDVDEATSAVSGAHSLLRGTLTVTAPAMFGRLHVTPAVSDFLAAHPEVSARLLLADRIVDLVERDVDVAVRIAQLRNCALRSVRVGVVRRVLCASPTYLAKHGRPKSALELSKHSLIAYADDVVAREWRVPHAGSMRRIAIAPRLTVNSTEATIAAAVAGHGITGALSYQVAEDVRLGRLVILLQEQEPPPIPVQVVHAVGSPPVRVRKFIEFLVQRLRAELLELRLGGNATAQRTRRGH
jgi:DNA-binding transcriptional LysR family regulator